MLALGAIGCGSSSSGGAAGAGGGSGAPGIGCDDPDPRVTGSPVISPASVPAGTNTPVDFAIPVTRTAYRVIVSVSQVSGASSTAVGITEQAYNDAAGCSVTVNATLHDALAKGKYFPAITIEAQADAGAAPMFLDYGYQPVISKTNYTLIGGPGAIADSGIAIPFVAVQ
jgi:hypothetical protein